MKKKIYTFLIIFLAILLSYILFFKFHLVSDAYRIIDNSNEYMINLKLIESRPVQALYFYILKLFNINIDSISDYIIAYRINLFISIIFLSISGFLIYNQVLSNLKNKNFKQKIFLMILTLTICINVSMCEYMLFIENYIIIFGFLLTIISTLLLYKKLKFKYILIIILLLISSFCYQGVTAFFVPFSLCIYLIKNKDAKIKDVLKKVVSIMFIYLFVQGINYIICTICNKFLPHLDPRLFNSIFGNVDKFFSFTCIFIYMVSLVIFFIELFINIKILYNNNFKNYLLNIIYILILAIISFSIFLFNNSVTLTPRMFFSFVVVYSILEIYLISIRENNIKYNNRYNLNIIIVSLILIFNICIVVILQYKNIYSTKQNIEAVNNIVDYIKNYENQNNTKINNICFYEDKSINYSYWKVYDLLSSTYTNPIYYGYWSDIYSIKVLSSRKFNKIDEKDCDTNISNYFKDKDWDEPNLAEQIIFINDTAHICCF